MTTWVIKDADGNVTNPGINAPEEFVKANFDYYEAPAVTALSKEFSSILWRNDELKNSDWVVQVPDHPQKTDYTTYRAALRNWPSTADFPDTKPTL